MVAEVEDERRTDALELVDVQIEPIEVEAAIAAALEGRSAPEPRLVNTCYSLVAPDYGISVGALYGAAGGRISTLSDAMSPLQAGREIRAREAAYAHDWYAGIVRDTYGDGRPG